MSQILTTEYMIDPTKSNMALDIAAMDEPSEPYLRTIWRHAFMLALAGLDTLRYGAQKDGATLWRGRDSGAAQLVDRAWVYDNRIEWYQWNNAEITIRPTVIDGRAFELWVQAHGGTIEKFNHFDTILGLVGEVVNAQLDAEEAVERVLSLVQP